MKTVAAGSKQKMWQIMRGLLTFAIDDLITLAAVKGSNARNYVASLKKAGYVRLDGRRKAIRRACRVYRLIKNTGPKAPIQRDNSIYDPNINSATVRLRRRQSGRATVRKNDVA